MVYKTPVLVKSYINFMSSIRGLSRNTTESYKNDLIQFLRYVVMAKNELFSLSAVTPDVFERIIDDNFITSITRDDIYGFIYYLDSDCKCSVSTRKRKLSAINKFYEYLLLEEKVIDVNPASKIAQPKLPKKEPGILELDEVNAFIEAIKENSQYPERDVCIAIIVLHLGLRRSEVEALNLQDVKRDYIRVTGKGNKERYIPLDDITRDWLDKYIPTRLNVKSEKDKDALFISRKHVRLTGNAIYRMVKNFMKIAMVNPSFAVHSLRHTFATNALQGSNDIVSLQDIMGHSDINTTRRYVHRGSSRYSDVIKNSPLNNLTQMEIDTSNIKK